MSNYCKYYRQQKYMSIDGGVTWTPLEEYQKGRLIERNSDECGYVDPIYRTITSEPYCSGETGYDKYVNELSQVSYNNGASWITTATTPILIEQYSQDCGYVPLTKWERITPTSDPDTYICEDCSYVRAKWVATYTDSHVESADCDSNSSIIINEITKTNLSSVQIGDCVTSIGFRAFQNCTSLTGIDIPSGVIKIAYGAFQNCISLTSIDIPSGVTSISGSAFRDCSGLTSITCLASEPPALANHVFDGSSCTIYVPCESIDAYKAANGWSTYTSRIQGIPPCLEPQYRQTSGTPYCSGVDKYQDVYDQVSYDGGTSWETTATTSVLIEAQSSDCVYVPPSFSLNSYINGSHYIRGTLTGTINGTNGFSSSFEHNGDSATKTLVDNIEGTLRTYGYVMDSKYNTIEPYGAITKTVTITTIEGIIYTITLYIGKGLKGQLITINNK